MIFINPKTDFAFRKIFGSEQSHGILISFLNGILYEGQPIVKDLTILDPYLSPRIRGVKDSYLDVRAILGSGETIIIEMQVLNVEGFEKRILYNAAKSYSIQLDKGEKYAELSPVIALTITDFEMFPEIDRPISRFVLKEKECLIDYLSGDLQLVFLELPKFKVPLDELQSLTDKWIYFMKHAPDLNVVPQIMGNVTEIQRAFDIANRAMLTREELDELENQSFFIQDQQGAIVKALKQGIKQGLEQGIEQGNKQTKIEIARRLIGVVDDRTISEMTDLTLDEITDLK